MAKKASNTARKHGGERKKGRNRIWCAAYRSRYQREKNKRAALKKHIERHPNDEQAKEAL